MTSNTSYDSDDFESEDQNELSLEPEHWQRFLTGVRISEHDDAFAHATHLYNSIVGDRLQSSSSKG